MPRIKELLAREVDRTIEEVIKVDQDDAAIIRTEIEEYVVTDSILEHYLRILERFDQTPANPHEGIGIWVSGFFGSGKSSFAKILGLALANRDILGARSSELFGARRSDSHNHHSIDTVVRPNTRCEVTTNGLTFQVTVSAPSKP